MRVASALERRSRRVPTLSLWKRAPRACGLAVGLATAVSVLAATPSAAQGRTADAAVTTLNFWGTIGETYYSSAISEYEKLNPGIKIVYHIFPFDVLDTVISSHMSTHDSSYAVYEVDEPRALEFASKGWLVPMDAATTAEVTKDVPSEQLGEVEYQGKPWALPLSTSTQLLYYNKKLLAKAGVTPPPIGATQGWTWQQLFAAYDESTSSHWQSRPIVRTGQPDLPATTAAPRPRWRPGGHRCERAHAKLGRPWLDPGHGVVPKLLQVWHHTFVRHRY